jgi:hypothetical protein
MGDCTLCIFECKSVKSEKKKKERHKFLVYLQIKFAMYILTGY